MSAWPIRRAPVVPYGMAHGDGAPVHVEPVVRNAQLVAAIDNLHREGLVEFPQVDVGHRLAGPLEQFRDGEHRADAHFVRLTAGHREAAEHAQRLQVQLLRASVELMTTDAEAPSENWLALPAAITPPGFALRIFDTAS